jgi:hypothetical protein
MSFDLYVFDMAPVPKDFEAMAEILEALDDEETLLTKRLAAFVAELEARYPPAENGSAGSPWAGPLKQSSSEGTCCTFNIVWSAAPAMIVEMVDAAKARGLTTYDPQADKVTEPDGTSYSMNMP